MVIPIYLEDITGSVGLNWNTARSVILLFGPIGLTCYAFGLRFPPRGFWRACSVPAALFLGYRMVRAIGRMVAEEGHKITATDVTVVFVVAFAIAMISVAMFRLAGFITSPEAQRPRGGIAEVFR